MPFPKPIEWTDEMVASLKRLWQSPLSCEKIGAQLGMSKNAVVGKANRIGLPQRKIRPSRRGPRPEFSAPRVDNRPDIPPPEPLVPVGEWFGPDQCKYIYGDPAGIFQFCGHPRVTDKPYCEYHVGRCSVPNLIGKVRT